MRIKVWSVVAVVLLLAACGGPKPQAPGTKAQSGPPDTSHIQIHGDASGEVNKLAIQAIADLQDYWSKEMPKLYGKDYEPVKGGFYAVVPSSGDLPPCASLADDISGNAFYCAKADDVAWDAEGLLPTLKEKYGDFVIPVVLAHEWGHAIQGLNKLHCAHGHQGAAGGLLCRRVVQARQGRRRIQGDRCRS